MKNSKAKLFTIAILLFSIATGIVGCKKCYTCSHLVATVICHKNTDTIFVLTATGRELVDSLNYYGSIGYICDTVHSYYTSTGLYRNPMCGEENYNRVVIDNQDKCVPQ